MSPLQVGAIAPEVPGVRFGDGPVGLFFYKVTCPTCQMAAPKVGALERAYPDRVIGIGQDPPEALERFAQTYGLGLKSVPDQPPYEISDAYGIVSVPTLFLVGADATVLESVGAWDRGAFNRVSHHLAELTAADPVDISEPGDGLPAFQPG
jgi:thiol-disulfide isomerase/thioredoxin